MRLTFYPLLARHRHRFLTLAGALAFLVLGPAIAVAQPVPPRRVVVNLNGKLVDHNEFRIVGPHFPFCLFTHYHAKTGTSVTALDGSSIADPAVVGCGYAPFGGLPVGVVYELIVPDADFDGVPDQREIQLGLNPNNPDSNNNGILDGDEDNDGDFLTNIEEIILFNTQPNVKDSDGNGIQDNVQVTIARTKKDFTVIPVIVNVHPTSTVDTDYARESIENANKVLKKANIRLEIVSVDESATAAGTGDDGTGGGTADDGAWNINGSRNEFGRALGEGVAEVNKQKNKKGIKLIFGRDGSAGGVLEGTPTPGASLHKYPVIIAQKRDTPELTGATIAHELGHAFTLRHHPDDDPNAHPDEQKAGNWMNPSASIVPGLGKSRDEFVNSNDPDKGIDNVDITDRQRAVIHGSTGGTQAGGSHSYVQRWGIQGTMNSPAVQIPYSIGFGTDAVDDHTSGSPAHSDLGIASFSSNANLDTVDISLSMNSLFDAGAFTTVYSILMDTDNDVSTGAFNKGVPGIEREITIEVTRATASDPVIANAYLQDFQSFTQLALAPNADVSILEQLFDLPIPGNPFYTGIELRVPKVFLDMTADEVPITVMSTDLPDNPGLEVIFDSVSLSYDRRAWEADPSITLFEEFADPGQALLVEISNLTPGAPFDLMIDGRVILSDNADGSGDFAGQFALPADLAPGLAFVTTVSDGAVGVSAVTILPEPGVLCVFAVSLLVVARRLR